MEARFCPSLGITTGRGFAPTSICRTGGPGSWSRSDRRPSREASPSPYPFRRRFAAPGLYVPSGLRESEARACSSAGQSAPLIRVRSVVQIDSGPPVAIWRFTSFGAVAQMGERLLCKQEVAGSIPASSTRFRRPIGSAGRYWMERRIGSLLSVFGNSVSFFGFGRTVI